MARPTFYRNKILEQYANIEYKPVSLRQLVVFGRSINAEKLLRSANYIREELPVRLAHRIRKFQQLPYVMGTNPHFSKIYNLYWDAFETIRSIPPITSTLENNKFCNLLSNLLNTHRIAIPHLARGIADSSPYMSRNEADKFMNETIKGRIGRRVLAEHQIQLTKTFENQLPTDGPQIGIVNSACRATEIIQKCIDILTPMFVQAFNKPPPKVVVDGVLGATFMYIPEHIEYLLFEILKNSMRFTALRHQNELPPIRVTIGMDHRQVVFRITDQSGGIENDVMENIWSWTHAAKRNLARLEKVEFLSGKMDEAQSLSQPLGLGLPMSLCYTKYWGGNLTLYSMPGHGTDIFITVATANNLEQLEHQ